MYPATDDRGPPRQWRLPAWRQPRFLAAALIALAAAVLGLGIGTRVAAPTALSRPALDAYYTAPLPPPPVSGIKVFHLGHSLVGREMPAMLAGLAGPGHAYDSQLGWGSPLMAHWEPDVKILGFDVENAHARFRPAREALESGTYDAAVFTEMVELRDAVAYYDSGAYLARWARMARAHNPEVRLFLYETWHGLDDPEGWLTRLDRDLPRLWEGRVLAEAVAQTRAPIHVIPAGQVLAAFVRAVAAGQGGPDVTSAADLFTGGDTNHLSDLGAYLVALTHYAVLYQVSPEGLPVDLARVHRPGAELPDPQTAALMQRIVWQVVTGYPKTGVPQG